jgi:ribonuclease HI
MSSAKPHSAELAGTTAMMTATAAHYLLFAEAAIEPNQGGSWRFVLENVATGESFSATDFEPIECHERLELLAVVRGLESIDHSARVTLVTKSRYVNRGLKRGLNDWRANGWQWERFGRIVPVRDHDLWKRVDRALNYHQVDCRLWQFGGEVEAESPAVVPEVGQVAVARPRRGRFTLATEGFRRASHAAASLGDAFRPSTLAAG